MTFEIKGRQVEVVEVKEEVLKGFNLRAVVDGHDTNLVYNSIESIKSWLMEVLN